MLEAPRETYALVEEKLGPRVAVVCLWAIPAIAVSVICGAVIAAVSAIQQINQKLVQPLLTAVASANQPTIAEDVTVPIFALVISLMLCLSGVMWGVMRFATHFSKWRRELYKSLNFRIVRRLDDLEARLDHIQNKAATP